MSRSNRNVYFGGVVAVFVIVSVLLYANLDSGARNENALRQSIEVKNLQKELDELQEKFKKNEAEVKKLESQVALAESKRKEILNKQIEKENEVYDERAEAKEQLEKKIDALAGIDEPHAKPVEKEEKEVGAVPPDNVFGNKAAIVHNALHAITPSSSNVCSLRRNYSHVDGDIQMVDLYDLMSFDNPDGGVWKQGWEIKYDSGKVQQEPQLQVIVIPHSHCDPGWIKTFEQYYQDQTKHILDGMVKHLELKPDMRFIYAEISFFERWWKDQSDETRGKVRKYLESGQFELVTGGWVMTDEANAHYPSIVAELMEGHEWIKNHIGNDYRPRSHWSIDPFGLSPSIPHLLSASNITNAVLQRVHYSVKKQLAKNKQLEFMWQQMWGSRGHSPVRTHVFPFYSYDVPHTCGPEPRICCQFDFRRLAGGGLSCPWNVPPKKIDAANIEERSYALYDQYRKKSQLYKTNVLLIPLGDDFRYDNDFEWDGQHDNYKQLFDNMNKRTDWNVHAKFGTVHDYFQLLEKTMEKEKIQLPSLSGDFFTYADRDDHYWSGYFTSRPFYKQMDRILQHYLRAAEMAFTLNSMKNTNSDVEIFSKLVLARRASSLFQHHDGITGTAKDAVVVDYGNRMLDALNACEKVLANSLQGLIPGSDRILLDEYRERHDMLATPRIYKIGESVILFNTLSHVRSEVACIRVDTQSARIKGRNDISQQISPIFELKDNQLLLQQNVFELCFVVTVPAASLETFQVVSSTGSELFTKAAIRAKGSMEISAGFELKNILEDTFTIENSLVTAVFNSNSGFLKSVTPSGGSEVAIDLQFVTYGARGHKRMNNGGGDDLSGAYLFLPNGEAKLLNDNHQSYVVVDGPLVKKVYVVGPKEGQVLQSYTLKQGEHSVEIENLVNVKEQQNFELAMRLNSNVESGDDLFTDLNGLQMIRRRRMLSKLPLQAHFYPMSSAAYIEDSSSRISLLTGQALGVASLKSGQLDIMLDRTLAQDDGRGLFQGVEDNKLTHSRFRLLVEPLSGGTNDDAARIGFLSMTAVHSAAKINYPWVKMIDHKALQPSSTSGLIKSLPCDVHLVTFRTTAGPTLYGGTGLASPKKEAAFILHRPLTDCRSKIQISSDCSASNDEIDIKEILPSTKDARSTSLTLLYEGNSVTKVKLDPQDVKTVKIIW